MLRAQPSATTRSLFASWGPWSSTSHRRQQTGAVGPPTLLQHIHTKIHTKIHPDPRSSLRKPNPESTIHTPDDNVSCAPGNIIIIIPSPRSLTRSLARWLEPTHPPTHATRLPKLPSDDADRFCFYLLYKYPFPACSLTAWLACICVPTSTKHRATPAPTSPVFGQLHLQNGPRRPFPLARSATAARRSKN